MSFLTTRRPEFCLAALLGVVAATVSAQVVSAQQKEGDPAPVAAGEAFTAAMKQWEAREAKLKALAESFQKAGADERAKIRETHNGLVDAQIAAIPKLTVLATKAFAAAPNKDAKATQFLMMSMAHMNSEDRFDEALVIGQTLLKGKAQEKGIDRLVGVAAYGAGDFKLAKDHLGKAMQTGGLSRKGQQFNGDVDTAITLWENEQRVRKAEAKANNLPRVRMETNRGVLVIELFENEAPQAVGNFVSLVEKKYYDGLTFHRVLGNFMAQGGCPKGDGTGGPGYKIYCECDKPNHRKHFRGSLSMAHAGKNTGGSQFFLTFLRTPHLDGRHTVFGRVVEGLDVLAKLRRRDPFRDRELKPDRIVKATVIRKRDHAYSPTVVK